MMHNDDFDTDICPEEFQDPNEDMGFDANDENLIDDPMDYEYLDRDFDEGSDRDNWEEQQVFLDRKGIIKDVKDM